MAKASVKTVTAPAPLSPTGPKFEHEGRAVIVLLPANDLDAQSCKVQLENDYFCRLESPPEAVTELEPYKLPQDAVVYVVHPTRKRKKQADGRFLFEYEPHISEPFDMSTLYPGGKIRAKVGLDIDKLASEISARCSNNSKDREGRFFRAQVSSVDKAHPHDVMVKVTDL